MTEPSEALKPCPFCGGDGEIALRHIGGTGSSGMETPEPFARCKSGCVEMNPVRCTDWPYGRKSKIPTGAQARKIAITAWNTRAMRVGEPVAWLYQNSGDIELLLDCNGERARRLIEFGYTEQPLYTHPAPDTAYLFHLPECEHSRAPVKLCDCPAPDTAALVAALVEAFVYCDGQDEDSCKYRNRLRALIAQHKGTEHG